MILRRAVDADRPLVVDMAMHFHESTAYTQLLHVDPDRVAAQFNMALANGVVIVAERDDVPGPGGVELVGFLALVATTHMLSGDRYAEECGWWVEPPYRSGTLGPRLLRWAEDWARTNGCVLLKMGGPAGALIDVNGRKVYEQTTLARFYELSGYEAFETVFLKRVA